MGKCLFGLFALSLVLGVSGAALAFDGESIYNKYQAVYLPSNSTWSTGAMADNRIVLTKKTTAGSGSYSEYYYSNGKLAAHLNSNYEFIKGGKLIAVNNAHLKYSKVVYKNGKFVEVPLTDKEIKEAFDGAEIVKVSEFKDGAKVVKKSFFKPKEIILVNDTDKDFYKFEPIPRYTKKTDVNGLLKLYTKRDVTLSHYGDKDTQLIINVK